MVRIRGKPCWLFVPALTDVLIGCESFERFESLREVISHQESLEMLFQVVVGLIVVLFHGGLFERAVHPFDLAIGPRMVGLGQPMVNTMLVTNPIKDMLKGVKIAFAIRELDAVIGQHRVDLVGYHSHQVPQELSRDQFVGFGMQLGIGKPTGAVNRDKQESLPSSVRTSAISMWK